MRIKILAALILTAIVPYAAYSQDAGCTNDDCHIKLTQKKWVHGPVGANICNVCHQETDKKKHKFELTLETDELCFSCHEDKRDMMSDAHVHSPVEAGECTGCHDPHQSDYRFQLLTSTDSLCFLCHDSEPFSGEYMHGPVGVGDCVACHNPHASENEFQLMVSRAKVCFECHPEKESEANSRHPHAPVQDDCTNCHNPHSNSSRYMFSEDSPDLCFQCHEEIESKLSSATPHPPFAEGTCMTCHQIHGSDNPTLFAKPQEGMCLECHTEMADYIANSSNRHGPVIEGDCTACHDGHGSDQRRILRQHFPEQFYNPYSTDKYALCFNCHNKQIALDSLTTTLTDFRKGNINLHYKHVNKSIKGRSCKACHEIHASNQEKHIRELVPFGKTWNYPIKYTKHADGGSCVVGCHKPQTYSREQNKQ